MTLAFTAAEYEDRVSRARQAIAEGGLDALIVTSPENICYLSGFWTAGYHVFQALVVPARKDPFLVIRNIEMGNVDEHSWIKTAYPINNLDIALDTLTEALRAEGVEAGRIGVEVDGARFTVTRIDQISALLPGATFVPALDLVEPLRAIKSDRHPNVMILSDDIYEHLVFGHTEFATMAAVAPELRERTVTVNGVSKAYCM